MPAFSQFLFLKCQYFHINIVSIEFHQIKVFSDIYFMPMCPYLVGVTVECHPTECQPAECQPTECHFYNIRPNVTQPNVTRPNVTYGRMSPTAECHLRRNVTYVYNTGPDVR
jgi:hypothetical protein